MSMYFYIFCVYLTYVYYNYNKKTGVISGVVSERDYVCKIALLGKTSKEVSVKGKYYMCV